MVYDGDSRNATLLAKKCGNETPKPIYSSGPNMLISFNSDSSIQTEGFQMKFTAGLFLPSTALL
ncbi:hypothetical protein Ciccas_011504 [Cichlidogyrus casuarinus]|uniref:CUB domain-containing protein n=1 Tax=Cichlidogyrus casuarinus TaxID=1844966 RepID=A0ABD2PRW9_9PLAT